jgi:hypothetical protein
LISRFDEFPVHRLCFDHFSTTTQELRQCIGRSEDEDEPPLVDDSIPCSVFNYRTKSRSITSPSGQASILSYSILERCQLQTGNRLPVDQLDSGKQVIATRWPCKEGCLVDWSVGVRNLGELEWSPLWIRRGPQDECVRRGMFRSEWVQLKGGRSKDGSKRQALDREECRCACGSDVVIPSVVLFLRMNQ